MVVPTRPSRITLRSWATVSRGFDEITSGQRIYSQVHQLSRPPCHLHFKKIKKGFLQLALGRTEEAKTNGYTADGWQAFRQELPPWAMITLRWI